MKRGIEVIIHDTEELERKGETLEHLASQLRWLCAKVYVDTAGSGSFVLAQLRADRIKAEPLPKDTGRDVDLLRKAHADGYELGRKHAEREGTVKEAIMRGMVTPEAGKKLLADDGLRWLRPDPTNPWENKGRAADATTLNVFPDRLNLLEDRISVGLKTQDQRVTALEQKLEAALIRNNGRHTESSAALHGQRSERWQKIGEAADRFVHGSGCQLEGQESVAHECIECEPVRGEPTRDENGMSFPPLQGNPVSVNEIAVFPGGTATVKPLECLRRYPLDSYNAEDPCEDCGRDKRKHEIADLFTPSDE